MDKRIDKLLLSELRMVAIQRGSGACTDAALVEAMTANENLLELGYTLSPADLVRLAGSPSVRTIYDHVKELTGDVEAEPMYPGFPEQVMEMEEAQFRLHQMLHYFTTYGIEELTGMKVSRGWLPEGGERERTAPDRRLLRADVLELVAEDEICQVACTRILAKHERMTCAERALLKCCLDEIPPEFWQNVQVAFKENLHILFYAIFSTDRPDRQAILRGLCKHTGDVLRCIDYTMCRVGYHFRTSQKKFLVRLLESYPVSDFASNVILSSKKAGRSLLVLQYLDYNEYSRSPVHRAVVAGLRDGDLRSWESRAKRLIASGDEGALDFVAERPGMMLRMLAWLRRLGYPKEALLDRLLPQAKALSSQSLIGVINYFKNGPDYGEEERTQRGEAEKAEIVEMAMALLRQRLREIDTPLRGKKVFLDRQGYDLRRSRIEGNAKSAEGGYVPSGTAYAIPDGVRYVRLFVYWDDPERVDVDLHAAALTLEGERISIGWDGDYMRGGIVCSGDITHSDAAEYIDVDLEAPLDTVSLVIDLYSGKNSFREIETCFAGIMAVSERNQEVRLYDPANCFFSHKLMGEYTGMQYGYLDVKRRELCFIGKACDSYWTFPTAAPEYAFSTEDYIDMLFDAQDVERAGRKEDAEVTVTLEKAEDETGVSLLDNNFFLDA